MKPIKLIAIKFNLEYSFLKNHYICNRYSLRLVNDYDIGIAKYAIKAIIFVSDLIETLTNQYKYII